MSLGLSESRAAIVKHALAILTCSLSRIESDVRSRLPHAIESLVLTDYPGPVFVVDDGSDDARHLKFLNSLRGRFHVVCRSVNGGISRAKNTCLRLLMQNDIDVGFIAEDDVEFRRGWHEEYLRAHDLTRIKHFSWSWDLDPDQPMKKTVARINHYPVVRTSHVNGLLLSFTPDVIATVGGFKLLPGLWGHEHTNWTQRIIRAGLAPFFADICNSNRFIQMGPYGNVSTISEEEKRKWTEENLDCACDFSELYFPLSE